MHVGFNRPCRRFHDQLHANGRRQVEDHVRAIHHLADQRFVHHRVDRRAESRAVHQVRDVVHRFGRQIVDDLDGVALRKQASARCDPTNPAPPVNNALIGGVPSSKLHLPHARLPSPGP
jgi:hypothetical protein